jgi:hypothetical protein
VRCWQRSARLGVCLAGAFTAWLLTGSTRRLDAQGAPSGGNRGVGLYAGTWEWGDRGYATEFGASYPFTNNCDRPVVVTFDSRGVPFVRVMPRVDAAPGTHPIPATLVTPPWPDRPRCTDLKGPLVVESSGYESEKGACRATRTVYTVTAHVHWWDRPAPPPKLEVAGPDACTVWWNTGQRPPNAPTLSEETCVDTIRTLAAAYREWLLEAAQGQPPDRWSWLPTAEQLATISVEAALQMKARADRQLRPGP